MSDFEWPTENKLAELREKGIVPYSSTVTRCVVIVALFLCLNFSREDIVDCFYASDKLDVFELVIKLFFIPTAVVLASIFFSILLQTKFLFKFGFILNNFKEPFLLQDYTINIIYTFLKIILETLVFVCGGYFIGDYLLKNYLQLLQVSSFDAFPILWRVIESIIFSMLIILSLIAVVSRYASKFKFLYNHRMKPDEME